MPGVCRFRLPEGLERVSVEAQLALAIVVAECAFGQAKVRMHCGYSISSAQEDGSSEGIQVAIDVSSDVGEHVAQVFTGLLIRRVGEEMFTVDRV